MAVSYYSFSEPKGTDCIQFLKMQQSGHTTVLQKQSDPSEALLPIYNQDALKSLDNIIISNKPFQ
jgi:hypothetical protein